MKLLSTLENPLEICKHELENGLSDIHQQWVRRRQTTEPYLVWVLKEKCCAVGGRGIEGMCKEATMNSESKLNKKESEDKRRVMYNERMR